MTPETLIHAGVTLGGWVALVSTMRSKLGEHSDRIKSLEKSVRDMPDDYVPRREITAILNGVDAKIDALVAYAKLLVRRTPKGDERFTR